MTILITDTCITLKEGAETFSLFDKPELPDYQNVTARPYLACYYQPGESIWAHLQGCMEHLADCCHDDPYFGCYALLFCRLYPLLLSSSQAKNVIAYGQPADCGLHRILQNFMLFLQEGNALTALAQSSFSFTALGGQSCHAFLYCLDICPARAAVCNAMLKVRPGGLFLLYTVKETLPAELAALCAKAETNRFGACTVYSFMLDAALADFARENSTESLLLSRSAEIIKRANDLQNLIQAMLAGSALPEDAYLIATVILQQTEEILLSLYDYLEDDALPIRTNALKEAVLNYYVGSAHRFDLTSYRQKLTLASDEFFTAIEREFS